MEKFEIYCESGSGGPARGFLGEDLCHACDVAELKALLSECDADEVKKLRRRVEDRLRKSPADLLIVAAELAASGAIRVDDLI